jgi:hypothetical protein
MAALCADPDQKKSDDWLLDLTGLVRGQTVERFRYETAVASAALTCAILLSQLRDATQKSAIAWTPWRPADQ